ncbi:hypothetical protein V8C37DRAFT_386363 [Trichoderma ceciliae]
MKVEEAEGIVVPLASIPSEDHITTQLVPPVNPKWSPQDAICAKLFGPWDNLPCYDHINEVGLLRELDNVIVLFETQIHHSDVGFRAWRERHKQAMKSGLAEIPGFPYLQTVRDGERIWHDDVWEQRYYYLVNQRQQIIMGRLSRLLALPRFMREDFFGGRPAPPRMILHRRGKGRYSRPLGLRCNWWKSLDYLLERAAEKWRMNEGALKARFWMDERAPNVKTQAPEWNDAVKEEGQVELSIQKENMEPLEGGNAGFAANLVSGALCFAHG